MQHNVLLVAGGAATSFVRRPRPKPDDGSRMPLHRASLAGDLAGAAPARPGGLSHVDHVVARARAILAAAFARAVHRSVGRVRRGRLAGFLAQHAAAHAAGRAPAISVYRPLHLDFARMHAHLAPARHSATAMTLALPHPGWQVTASSCWPIRARCRTRCRTSFPRSSASPAATPKAARHASTSRRSGSRRWCSNTDGIWIVRPESYGAATRYLSFRRGDLRPGNAFRAMRIADPIDPAGRNLLVAIRRSR